MTRPLPKFIHNEPVDPLAEQTPTHVCTEPNKYLSELFKNNESNIVYERVYPGNMNLKNKNCYYLTTLFNIKRFVYMQRLDDTVIESLNLKEDPTFIHKAINEDDDTLIFESRFESGNLALALKASPSEYDLFVQNDINTLGHTQWFFFRVNNKKAATVKFNINNFMKKESLFNSGMKIRVYSQMLATHKSIGWHRAGTSISYYQNQYKKTQNSKASFYTLSFTYQFQYDNDTVFFAYDKPYTYSDLQEKLRDIEKDQQLSK